MVTACSHAETPQRSHLIALQGTRARGSVLDPANVEHGAIEVDLIPTQVANLSRAQSVPEGYQDQGGVPMAAAVGLGSLDQGVDLARRQVLTSPKLGVRSADLRNCSENFGWRV